jgi:putative addiction module component (TIGR02574 family)
MSPSSSRLRFARASLNREAAAGATALAAARLRAPGSSTESISERMIKTSMPSERVRKVLAVAAKLELAPTERVELADELLRSVPEPEQQAAEFTPEWTAELGRRLAEMNAAEAQGESAGVVTSVDDLIAHVRATADIDE